jgi:hypothetical protein
VGPRICAIWVLPGTPCFWDRSKVGAYLSVRTKIKLPDDFWCTLLVPNVIQIRLVDADMKRADGLPDRHAGAHPSHSGGSFMTLAAAFLVFESSLLRRNRDISEKRPGCRSRGQLIQPNLNWSTQSTTQQPTSLRYIFILSWNLLCLPRCFCIHF